jgi:elongation factor P
VKGDDLYKEADFEIRPTQFLYEDQGTYTFMDQETFEQFELNKDDISNLLPFLLPEMEDLKAIISDGKVLAVEPPQKVTLTVEQTDPVMKGASATGRGKPARCETGLTVTVPEYIVIGEKIIIETATSEFVCRA